MSDLFTPLRTPEPVPTPSPAQIRRRGDRLRTRRRAATAGAVALALAGAVLAGQSLIDDPTRFSTPDVARDPEVVDVLREIPPSFDLGAGLTDGNGLEVEEDPWLGDAALCDASYSPADVHTDSTSAIVGGGEFSSSRDLRVFADEATATTMADDVVGKMTACPVFELGLPGMQDTLTVRNDVAKAPLGDRGWLVTQTYEREGQPQSGQNLVAVVQVRNTVLVTMEYAEGAGAAEPDLLAGVQDAYVAERVEPVVAQLECTFATGDC